MSLYNYYSILQLKRKYYRLEDFRNNKVPLLEKLGAIITEPLKNKYDIIFNGMTFRYNCSKDVVWHKETSKSYADGWKKLRGFIIKGNYI